LQAWLVAARICGGQRVWYACRLLRDGDSFLEHGVAAAMSGAAKNLIKKKYFYHMASILVAPRQKRNPMALGNNRGQKGSPICLGSKPEAK